MKPSYIYISTLYHVQFEAFFLNNWNSVYKHLQHYFMNVQLRYTLVIKIFSGELLWIDMVDCLQFYNFSCCEIFKSYAFYLFTWNGLRYFWSMRYTAFDTCGWKMTKGLKNLLWLRTVQIGVAINMKRSNNDQCKKWLFILN